ncbi:hypothetical protein MMC25_005373 [Agyrium rufum]|nr:hypothetical protein [Agyrium rufum]
MNWSKSRKHKKKNKPKPPTALEIDNGELTADNGAAEEDEDEPITPASFTEQQGDEESATEEHTDQLRGLSTSNGKISLPERPSGHTLEIQDASPTTNGSSKLKSRSNTITDSRPRSISGTTIGQDTEARLEALAQERTALRDEVTKLRRSLEEIQEKHQEELSSAQEQLQESQAETDTAKDQYQNLLGRVNTIRSNLGERLKADAEELGQARSHIEELEEENNTLKTENATRQEEVAKLAEEGSQQSKELSSLRNRLNLSQQNWTKEREDLVQREAHAWEEFETAKQAMADWEVLAMEERSIRENLADKVNDLEEQVLMHREAHEKAAAERDSQSLTVDGLQRALQEIQEARKRELREIVENTQGQIEELRKQLRNSQDAARESAKALEVAQKEIERTLPFEMEVKDKNLMIGKLRHEAVTLNDHLIKVMRYVKKSKPDDAIDKQVVTNHFLQFLVLDRSDPRRFQILQIIASLLSWTDEQREQAGLARPGASNPNLRIPLSPWHRTPSTPTLLHEAFPDNKSNRSESLATLWSDFLEQQAQEGSTSATPNPHSRSTSVSDVTRSGGG